MSRAQVLDYLAFTPVIRTWFDFCRTSHCSYTAVGTMLHNTVVLCCIVFYYITLYGISARSCMTNVTLTVQSNRNNTPCFAARLSAHHKCGIFLYKIKKLNKISPCMSASFSRTNRHSPDHCSLRIRQQPRGRRYSCD